MATHTQATYKAQRAVRQANAMARKGDAVGAARVLSAAAKQLEAEAERPAMTVRMMALDGSVRHGLVVEVDGCAS